MIRQGGAVRSLKRFGLWESWIFATDAILWHKQILSRFASSIIVYNSLSNRGEHLETTNYYR